MNLNTQFLMQLLGILYNIPEAQEIDRLFSERFGRQVISWRLFRYLIRMSVATDFVFNPSDEVVGYAQVDCDSFEQFVTVMLHEATHGVCHFVAGEPESELRRFSSNDEEGFCWKVSEAVCSVIGVAYDKELADNLYAFNLAVVAGDGATLIATNSKLPACAREQL